MDISFLNDLPYFFTVSLSSTPVSRVGGSFCRVSIKTWKDREKKVINGHTEANTVDEQNKLKAGNSGLLAARFPNYRKAES